MIKTITETKTKSNKRMFAIIYLLLIAVLVAFSWVGSVYGLLLPDGTVLPSLLSADSVRWFVRHSIDNIAAAPLVEALLVLLMVGAVEQSGIGKIVMGVVREHTLPSLSRHQRYALHISLFVFIICVLVIVVGLVGPGGNLLSVTGRISGGPFARGWLPLLCVCVCIPCISYGWIGDLWNSGNELLSGLTAAIARCSGYFVTLIVASQLIASVQYLRLFELIGWGSGAASVCVAIVYGLPLIVSVVRD